jgi:predicted DNA-binding protein
MPGPKHRRDSMWKQKAVYLPVALASRLRDTARATKRTEKAVIVEALEAKLSPRPSKPPNDSGGT